MVPDQRTLIVLGSLIGGMTLISGLLLVLEPGPVAPLSGITLTSVDVSGRPADRLFGSAPSHAWQAIVIHDSNTLQGSSRTLNELHEKMGRKGLGYHFVINNGRGEADGLIEVGFRWTRQLPGAYVEGQGAEWFNRNAIGICLIGDTDRQPLTQAQLRELVWLVQQLQRQYNIPGDKVVVQMGEQASVTFPHLWFRQQLLNPTLP